MAFHSNPHPLVCSTSDIPAMLPRTVQRTTPLVRQGRSEGIIVYPDQDSAYRELARELAAAVARRTRVELRCLADAEIISQRGVPLPSSYRRRPLILLGNLNTNRVLLPLYARYYCATDATYPGGSGYDLRTLLNPYGTGVNWILAGGSTLAGMARAVERLIEYIDRSGAPGELVLPCMLEVDLEPALARRLAQWPETPLNAPLPQTPAELLKAIGAYAILYAWTGNLRYGEFARDCLRSLNARVEHSYGDWHYLIERIIRALPWLSAGGLLDEADLLRTDELLLRTAIETQDMWWRKRDGHPPLGHRHHGKGTYAFYLQARFLREQGHPNPAASALCDRWMDECRAFLDALAEAGIDDQNDESTLNNLATLVWYSLGEERYAFFESGNARRCAQRAIAVHDNMGAGAGLEGYGEGWPGAMYLPQEAGIMVAACAFYYQDGELKWVLEHMPNLKDPIRMDGWSLSPTFMHKFDSGPELTPVQPQRLTGLQRLPLSPYQIELAAHPPEHVEPKGHSVNAPETWLHQGGVGRSTLPSERTFDKLVFRKNFDPQGPYLLVEGYQGGFRWQGSMHAANAIVRFSQAGHIFLIQNTDRQSYYHKNALLISDGYNRTPLPPLAEWITAADFPAIALSATRMAPVHHTCWTRYIFWAKPDDGFFVVIDTVEIQEAGPFTVTCTWRTPGYATLQGRFWRARQGDHIFTLCCSQELLATSEEQGIQGAVNPYVLRQRQHGVYDAKSLVTFQNLFYVQPIGALEPLDILFLTSTQALIVEAQGQPLAWCAVDPQQRGIQGAGMKAQAVSLMAMPQAIALSGVRSFEVEPAYSFRSDRPVGLCLDLNAGRMVVRADGPDSPGARIWISQGDQSFEAALSEDQMLSLSLSPDLVMGLAARLQEQFHAWRDLPRPVVSSALPAFPEGNWHTGWEWSAWHPVQERIRSVAVTARPAPVDGFPEQLVDAVLPEWRTLVRQWPEADRYEIRLDLGEEIFVDHLRVIGDSLPQPTLRTFHPLPEGIQVMLSSDGFQDDQRLCHHEPRKETVTWPRFHGWEDRFESLRFPIADKARQIQIHIPSPPAGEPLICHEIELYSNRWNPPPIKQLISADLDHDGRLELVAISSAHELVALDEDGAERWRWQAPNPVTHVSCHDLDGRGCRQICVGLLGGRLVILDPDGAVRRDLSLAHFHRETKGLYFGMLHSVHGLAIWHREPDGRGALALGGYALVVFLDPDGEVLGHSWADGSWQVDLLPCPPEGQAPWDLWVRNRWNHGICVYEGQPGLEPSGEAIVFGGLRQPMFRPLRRVIPFVAGDSVAFEWIGPPEKEKGYILAAAEHGVGLLSPARESWIWKLEGSTYIQACITADVDHDGEIEVLVGGANGFVSVFGLADGSPKQRLLVGAPVTGLAAWPGCEVWFVGTQERLLAVDLQGQLINSEPLAVHRLCPLAPGSVVVATRQGRLVQLTYEPAIAKGYRSGLGD
ncbi:MAG: hypothetical protein RML36_10900 [Anaerolineae bacterium]|nr:PQQ-like beta-propeller repeat protein [Anaerolineae bacterium]MDW8099974.1 hypothetical protein [Anaerolineae bacterium]